MEKLYALVMTGTDKTVVIEEGLFYGQPLVSNDIPQIIGENRVKALLSDQVFVNTILVSKICEFKCVDVTLSPLKLVATPEPIKYTYTLSE